VVEVAFAVPGELAAPTGGYAYARKLLELLPAQGVRVKHVPLPGSFPHPSAADLDETKRSLSGTPDNAVLLIDGLAYGAVPAELAANLGRPIVALVHHPLGLESGLAAEPRSALLASEAAALALARRVIVTSLPTARLLAIDFAVPPDRIAVAEPGVEPAARARGTGVPAQLLAVGAVSPRKGYDILVEALSGLKRLDWRLTIVGSLDRNPEAARLLRQSVAAAGLGDRVALAGAVGDDVLHRLYDEADVFVSASLFEGYGMVLAEAMAHGLAIVTSAGGAAAETVADGAGLKVPPGDADALREALRRLIAEPQLRRTFAEGSWAAGRKLPSWADTAAVVARVLEGIAP
jgi:glycosyltransferase involved in cell wall biosynthesis